jgi:mRNA interferase MazF
LNSRYGAHRNSSEPQARRGLPRELRSDRRRRIKKTRPALVIQNDIGNRYSPIIIVAAITSSFDETLYPTEVLIAPPEGGMRVPSVAALNQIRSVDIRRLTARLGALKPETMERVDRALKISVGLLEI